MPCVWRMLHSLHVKDELELLRMSNGFLGVVVGNPTLCRIYIIVFPWQSKFPPVDPKKLHYYHPCLIVRIPTHSFALKISNQTHVTVVALSLYI